MNAMEEKHLTIETRINGERIGVQEINDPFLHNRTTIEMSLWDRIRFLFCGKILVEIKIRGDDEAHRQWFRTDKLPRYNDEPQEEIATSAPNAAPKQQTNAADGTGG